MVRNNGNGYYVENKTETAPFISQKNHICMVRNNVNKYIVENKTKTAPIYITQTSYLYD